MSKDVIIACDFNSKADLMTFLDKFENEGAGAGGGGAGSQAFPEI